jgi:hypothetical protein
MDARRLVSKIKHLTGSYYRGEPRADYDRQTCAAALRIGRKSYRRGAKVDINSALTQWNPAWRAGFRPNLAIREPKLDRYRDGRSGTIALPVAFKNSR